MQFTYLLIDLGAISIPLLFTFHQKLRFDKTWKTFWPATALTAIFFVGWDMLYTKYGVWGFNEGYLTGINLGNLPLEEILFFICIPYASVFTYHCLGLLLPFRLKNFNPAPLSTALVLMLVAVGLYNYNHIYTSVTFIALALAIIWIQWNLRAQWLGLFYISYGFLILPFFIVNGLLTGTGLEAPIVWYDNAQNLGIRLLTIPLEDIFYGMLLILINVCIIERLKLNNEKKLQKIPAHRV